MPTLRDVRRTTLCVLLPLVGACRAGPAANAFEEPLLDTATVGRISTHVKRAVVTLRDSAAVAAGELEAARALNPDAESVAYLLAVARALADDTTRLAATFDTLAARHSCLAPMKGRSFPRWEGVPVVARAMQAVRDSAPFPGSHVDAFSLPDPSLFPEGITYDPADGSIFLGSLRQRSILRIKRPTSGPVSSTPFTAAGSDTLYSVLGLKVDAARRRLWALTAAEGFAEDERPDESGRSAVLVYDLDSGRRLRRFPISPPPGRLVNDLALDSAGAAYVTDTRAGALYRVALESDSVRVLLPPGSMAEPNGIVVTPDGRGLLVADGPNGLWYVDLATRALRRVPQPRGLMPIFLDGLAIHGHTLLAVAHPLNLGWVIRFDMSPGFDTIRAAEPLVCNDTALRQPTTGVVAGDTLFYIGTSQYPRIPPPGRPVDRAGLVDIVVRKLVLGG